jgi:basic membrane protein A
MTKQVGVAVYETVRSLVDGRFQAGVRVFGLEAGGVDYVYDEHNRGLVPAEARERVEALRREVVAGRIEVPAEVRR